MLQLLSLFASAWSPSRSETPEDHMNMKTLRCFGAQDKVDWIPEIIGCLCFFGLLGSYTGSETAALWSSQNSRLLAASWCLMVEATSGNALVTQPLSAQAWAHPDPGAFTTLRSSSIRFALKAGGL